MSTMYAPVTIKRLAETGDKFYQGAYWILRQQEAAQLTGARASFMSDRLSMDDARKKAQDEYFALSEDAYHDPEPTMDEILATIKEVRAERRTMAREDYDQEWTRVPDAEPKPLCTPEALKAARHRIANAADLGAPRIP